MNTPILAAIVLLSFSLCSCGVYQAASEDRDSQGYSALILVNPVTAVTGTYPFEQPSNAENEKHLAYYTRVIRNRNLGKVSSDDRRITEMAMQHAYPLLGKKSQKEVIELLGPPDRVIVSRGQTGFIYAFKGLPGSLNGPVLFFETDKSTAK